MVTQDQQHKLSVIEQTTSHLMHLHYCHNDVASVTSYFAPQFMWIGAGEDETAYSREQAIDHFHHFQNDLPKCVITDEDYHAMEIAPDTYLCAGTLWISTHPSSQMVLQVHQRVTFTYHWTGQHPLCTHIHCSNPYGEMLEGEHFPHKIGRQSYDFVQTRLHALQEESIQHDHQMKVIMSSIPGGLKTSRDDDTFSYEYVSPEAAALFGYTVEEFLQVTGGCAVGAAYPPDVERALNDCITCFANGGEPYSTKYRVPCKDGSLKWILDSGRKTKNDKGETLIYSLYLDITKEELAAQEILRQQQLLQSIYDTMPCGVLRFTRKDGVCQLRSLNKGILELLGYPDEQSCIANWDNGVAGNILPEDRALLIQTNQLLQQVGDRQELVYRVRLPDNSIRWLSATTLLISSGQSGDTIQRTMFDITERRLLQEQLEHEQEMYRVAMESSSDIMYEYLIDEDILVTYEPHSDADVRNNVLRREIPDFQRNSACSGLIHPDDTQLVVDGICQGRAELFEARLHLTHTSAYQWHRITGKIIHHLGRPNRVVGTLRNIHQEKQLLSANKEQLHMNQSALQALSNIYLSIYYVDLSADWYYGVRLPEYTPSLTTLRSGSFRGFLSDYVAHLVHPDDQVKISPYCDVNLLSRYLKVVGDRIELEYRHRTQTPESMWLRMEIQLISLHNASPKNAIVTFRNVTEDRQRELERRQEEALAKHALEDAYAAANRASQAKSDFLSKMSHDMRTPMNAIMGMTTIALQHLSSPTKLEDCLQKIDLSSRHLLELINEVLDMSKIESGKTGLNETIFNLYHLLQRTADMIRADADRKGHQLKVEVGALPHPTVLGDQVRLQQILLNLLSNAVKYTPNQGHITLSLVEADYPTANLSRYIFSVEDNGIGMPADFLDKLYIPFERAVDSRVSRVQGTGLGMAITQNLIQMMNGSIQVESHLDQGSRFTVTLCLKTARPDDSPIPCTAYTTGKTVHFTKLTRILLVEDNELNLEIATELLESTGLTVETAENGAQAVALFSSAEPGYYHLILMDIQMPIMDGYQATQAIRALARPDAATIPIVALTANAFADDVSRTYQVGINEHLSKPLEVSELTQAILRWVK